nr:MAG TPA: hypothetical protein [Bacteriophage sp.]
MSTPKFKNIEFDIEFFIYMVYNQTMKGGYLK